MKAVVITVSTKGYLGEREDKSGPALKARLEKIGFTVTKQLLLPDDREKLRDAMKEIADGGEAELIVTTGGTGFAKDDCTPEATLDIVERRADGIPKLCALTAAGLQTAPCCQERQPVYGEKR